MTERGMTKFDLMNMLFISCNTFSAVKDSSGVVHLGIVQSIEREDGSGKCFNVRMCIHDGDYRTVFVRTID